MALAQCLPCSRWSARSSPGTAGELVNFGKVANAVAYILANPWQRSGSKDRLCRSEEAIGQMGKMIGEANADFEQMAETFTKGSFRRAVEEQFALADATKAPAKAAETARKSLDTTERDRPVKRSAKAAAAAAQALRMALVNLEQKNIQIAFEIDQDKIKADIAALEDLFKRVGGKDLADQITALQRRQRIGLRRTCRRDTRRLVNALNAESKRINAMPMDGERDRALTAYVKGIRKARAAGERAGRCRRQAGRRYPQRNEPHPPADQGDRGRVQGRLAWSGRLREFAGGRAGRTRAGTGHDRSHEGGAGPAHHRGADGARGARAHGAVGSPAGRRARRPDRRATRGQQSGAGSDPAANRPDQERGRGADRTRRKPQGVGRRNNALEVDGGHRRRLFEDLFQNGRSAFGRLWDQAKSFFAKLAAQLLVKWVLNIDVSGGGVMGALGSILGGSSGGGGLIGNLLGGLLGGAAADC